MLRRSTAAGTDFRAFPLGLMLAEGIVTEFFAAWPNPRHSWGIIRRRDALVVEILEIFLVSVVESALPGDIVISL
jgi:hypothetical protein